MHKLDHRRAFRGRFVGAVLLGTAAALLFAVPAFAQAGKKAKPAKVAPLRKTKKATAAKASKALKKTSAKPTWKARNAAKKTYRAGVAAMKKKDFSKAASQFEASFNSVNSPNSKFMLVRALAAQGKLVAAYRAVVQTVVLAEQAAKKNPRKYKPTLDAANAEKLSLRKKVAIVRVKPESADANAKVFVAGQPLPASRWGKEFVVRPGATEILLRTANGDTKKLVTAAAGADMTVTVVAKAPRRKKQAAAPGAGKGSGFVYRGPDRRKMAYIAAAVGGTGVVLFGVLGVLSNTQLRRLENSCEGDICSADLESVRDRGAAMQLGANVSLGVGLAVLAAGGGLFAWDMIDKKKDKADKSARGPRLAVGPGSVVLSGSF